MLSEQNAEYLERCGGPDLSIADLPVLGAASPSLSEPGRHLGDADSGGHEHDLST